MLNGWLILDKPSGITSAHAVAKVKRLFISSLRAEGEAIQSDNGSGLLRRSAPRNDIKIGHAGTLDPLASGVLPLALGEATKTVNYMMDAGKAYTFTVQWGAETDTDDSEGKMVATSDKRPTLQEIEGILPQFIGEIDQAPPSYSAIKVDGKRAYDMARDGEKFELKTRKVRVDSLGILNETKDLHQLAGDPSAAPQDDNQATDSKSFICHCGKGTYIRSLARDMGRALGCYGHITALRRSKVGKFTESDAISLDKLTEMMHKGDLGFIKPVTSALDDIPAVTVTANQAALLRQGQPILSNANGTVQVLQDGVLIAIGDAAGGWIKPRRVFNL